MTTFEDREPDDTTLTAELRIKRTNERGDTYVESFEVPFLPGASVLDGLSWVRERVDASLAFRYACISANVCKECVMRINGANRYACMERLEAGAMSIEPVASKQVVRDLVCDTVPPKERLHPKR